METEGLKGNILLTAGKWLAKMFVRSYESYVYDHESQE